MKIDFRRCIKRASQLPGMEKNGCGVKYEVERPCGQAQLLPLLAPQLPLQLLWLLHLCSTAPTKRACA